MIRLIFCDVDGTLVQVNDQGELHHFGGKPSGNQQDDEFRRSLRAGDPAGRRTLCPRTYGRQFSFDTVAYSGAYVTASQKLIYESVFTLEEARAYPCFVGKSAG